MRGSPEEGRGLYIVAFRYTEKAGGYAGVVTWSQFPSKSYFEIVREELLNHGEQEVVEEGITADRAVELARQIPLAIYVRACLEEATIPSTGEVDDEILHHLLLIMLLARI